MKRYVRAARVGRQKEVYVTQEYVPDYGWEDICVYDDTSSQTRKEARAEVRNYIENGFGARLITRRVPNPDYVEPKNEITWDMVMDYFTGDKANLLRKTEYGSYLIGKYPNQFQVWERDDGSIALHNVYTNRTKQIYNMQQFETAIKKVLNG